MVLSATANSVEEEQGRLLDSDVESQVASPPKNRIPVIFLVPSLAAIIWLLLLLGRHGGVVGGAAAPDMDCAWIADDDCTRSDRDACECRRRSPFGHCSQCGGAVQVPPQEKRLLQDEYAVDQDVSPESIEVATQRRP